MEEMFMKEPKDPKKVYTGILVVLVLLFVLGLVLVLTSAAIGLSTAHAEVVKNGGSLDTTLYNYIMTNTAENYRIVGAILALISGVGLLLAGVANDRQKKG
jgi:multisubunit Na+/H+ antiporter MnhB subunit